MPFHGVLKYIIYIFIGGWLFLLGVMAGRGTSPVTFETRGFQERLQAIVKEYNHLEEKTDSDEKIALDYYDALSEDNGFEEMVIPVPAADPDGAADTVDASDAADPDLKKSGTADTLDPDLTDDIPVKTSKKAATFKKAVAAKPADSPLPDKKISVPDEKPEKRHSQGSYTIQVAAFKSFRDAVTQMTTLEKKGFTATRTSKEMDGITWYRIRIGEFASRDGAAQFLEKLNQAGINGMIITKE